jgi:glycine hydroxymethyltransferase
MDAVASAVRSRRFSVETMDAELARLLDRERRRQDQTVSLIASASLIGPVARACQASRFVNVTAEGYPRRRFHGGCRVVDEVEQLAIDRANALFGTQYANVQPHSASSANEAVLFGLLEPGDTLLGMRLGDGGHLTHGASVSISGRWFRSISYGMRDDGQIDFEEVERLAEQHRPKLLICGTTAYPREIPFAKFRAIADQVGAYVLADISHIAGLVACGLHESPAEHADFVTACTHKQLAGPRGGVIVSSRPELSIGGKTLAALVDRAVFPLLQGAPIVNAIAAKAAALRWATSDEFRALMQRIQSNARTLAHELVCRGYRVVTGGTDNHIVLVDLVPRGIGGYVAEKSLEQCGIVVNRNKVPNDPRKATYGSGIRLGTGILSQRGMGPREMQLIVQCLDEVLTATSARSDTEFTLQRDVRRRVRGTVRDLCAAHPVPY